MTGAWSIHKGDVLDELRAMPSDHFDAVLSDPPYGLGTKQPTGEEIVSFIRGEELDTGGDFMGKRWSVPSVAIWREAYRVLRPGAHMLIFGGTRTVDLITVGLRAAGFEIRDSLCWLYGSGFPKSMDVSRAVEPRAPGTPPVTRLGIDFLGHGTALKPAVEPIVLARKPLDGTVANNALRWGCGALAIDACRIGTSDELGRNNNARVSGTSYVVQKEAGRIDNSGGLGRFPANLLLDEDAAAVLDAAVGDRPSTLTGRKLTWAWCPHCKSAEVRDPEVWPIGSEVKCGACGERYEIETVTKDAPASAVPNPSKVRGKRTVLAGNGGGGVVYADNGGPSRFFYTSKVSTKERNAGCEHLPKRSAGEVTEREDGSAGLDSPRAGAGRGGGAHNHHPTLKPLDLTTYLARLLLPPKDGSRVLVPYSGSGSEMIGCLRAGWSDVHGIERDADYVRIAEARIAYWTSPKAKLAKTTPHKKSKKQALRNARAKAEPVKTRPRKREPAPAVDPRQIPLFGDVA